MYTHIYIYKVSLFDQIGTKKLQNPVFNESRLHYVYILRQKDR